MKKKWQNITSIICPDCFKNGLRRCLLYFLYAKIYSAIIHYDNIYYVNITSISEKKTKSFMQKTAGSSPSLQNSNNISLLHIDFVRAARGPAILFAVAE